MYEEDDEWEQRTNRDIFAARRRARSESLCSVNRKHLHHIFSRFWLEYILTVFVPFFCVPSLSLSVLYEHGEILSSKEVFRRIFQLGGIGKDKQRCMRIKRNDLFNCLKSG